MSKIALMCGHGRSTDGTWDSGTAYAGKTEAALMLPITKAAVKYLRSYGVEVISDADTNNDKNMIADVRWANKEKVVLYVSVHCDYYKAPSGVMPLYVSAKGKVLATALNDAIKNGLPIRSRGVVKRSDLYELNQTDAVACILETGSIKADINKLKESDKYGKCIAQGICNYLGIKAEAPEGKLAVDGKGGRKTVRRMQEFFGTTVDGVISGQNKDLMARYCPSITAVEYDDVTSLCVKNLQRWVGANQDGIIGQITVKLWEGKLGLKQDGVFTTDDMKAWQTYLNTHDKAEYPAAPKSTNAAKILAKVKEYAWAYGTPSSKYSYSKGSAKAAYKTALKKQMGKTAKVSQSDCGYFIDTCVRASGVDKKFLALNGSKEPFPSVPATFQVVHKGSKIPDGLLQPGDIIRYKKTNGHQHTLMYYGNGKIAEAGRKTWFPAIKKDTKKYNNSNVKLSTLQVLRAK